jgi:hypothetical protein
MSKNKHTCLICKQVINNSWLIRHVKKYHNISEQKYYDLVFPNEINKNCKFCNKKSNLFISYKLGYKSFCNTICLGKNFNKRTHELYPDLMIKIGKKLGYGLGNDPKRIKMLHDRNLELHPNHLSDMGKIGILKSWNNPNFGYTKNKSCYYKEIRMRSSWEKKFAELCDENNIKFEYEPKWFKLWTGRRYLPDFYLPEKDLWIEIRPKCYQNQELHMRGVELGINFKVLDKKQFGDFFKEKEGVK